MTGEMITLNVSFYNDLLAVLDAALEYVDHRNAFKLSPEDSWPALQKMTQDRMLLFTNLNEAVDELRYTV